MEDELGKAPETTSTEMRRFVRITHVALTLSPVGGFASVWSDQTFFILGGGTNVHHTFGSRSVLLLVSLYCAVLAVGFFRRSRRAWQAAFALPVAIFLVAGTLSWSHLSKDPTAFIPLTILAAIGVWQTVVWRRQWSLCEPYFDAA